MKQLIIFIIIFEVVFGDTQKKSLNDPCDHHLIKLAMKDGIKAIPIKDILTYKKLVKACEKNGGEKIIQQIEYKDYERDYRRSRTMSSWTSTYSICVFIVMLYYFIGLGTVEK